MNVAVFRFVRHNLTARLDTNVRDVSERFGVFRFRDVLGIEGFGDRRLAGRGNGQLPQAIPNADRGRITFLAFVLVLAALGAFGIYLGVNHCRARRHYYGKLNEEERWVIEQLVRLFF